MGRIEKKKKIIIILLSPLNLRTVPSIHVLNHQTLSKPQRVNASSILNGMHIIIRLNSSKN